MYSEQTTRTIEEMERSTARLWAPPERLTLSQWADAHFYLSAESSAEPGRWLTHPTQRGWMDAISQPDCEMVTVMKSARVGYTKSIVAAVGYFATQDPCAIMLVQPTIEDAKDFSKDEIATALRDCPKMGETFSPPRAKSTNNTLITKRFKGGSLSLVGANSPRGFRRVSRRVVIFDETDAYPLSAGAEGDQIKLGMKRSETFWNRKTILGSTPTIKNISKIEQYYEMGDKRKYYVPCPYCEHKQVLRFPQMKWPTGRPRDAKYECENCGTHIEHHHLRSMLELGEWRAEKPFTGHASFHIWTGYSLSPNATWGHIAEEFEESRKNPETLKTFVNTTLGETWEEAGEAPEYKRLYDRRESYPIGTCPIVPAMITAGVDVQKDSLRFEIVAWSRDKQSFSIDAGAIAGDTSTDAPWDALTDLLYRPIEVGPNGIRMPIRGLAVDSGYNTQEVYNWGRKHAWSRVFAVKGDDSPKSHKTIVSTPSKVDVNTKGRKLRRGYRVWAVGSSLAKTELYGWLRLETPIEGEAYRRGFCHFPEYGEEYFKQLTAEQLVTVKNKKGFVRMEWRVIPGRENHFLDCRVYARAAAAICGLDRLRPDDDTPPPPPRPQASQPIDAPSETDTARAAPAPQRTAGGFLGGRKPGGPRGGGWLKGRK